VYTVILIIHLSVSLILIAVILLQAGRGGGLAEIFGGGQSILGTRAATVLTKTTTACAVMFLLTSLTLAILSARQGQSLMERVPAAAPSAPAPTSQPAALSATTEERDPPESPAASTP